MSNVDNFVYQEAHRELRPGEVIFATGWMLRGRNNNMQRFICAATSQRMLVIEVKGSLMTGAPTTNAIRKFWIDLSTITAYKTKARLMKLAPIQTMAFVFTNGHEEVFSIPKMGQGMDGQPDLYQLLPIWIEAHLHRGTFRDPAGPAFLAQEVGNMAALRGTYAPKYAAKVARREGKAAGPKALKWPWAMAVLAFAVLALGSTLSAKQDTLSSHYRESVQDWQRKANVLSKTAKDKRTKKQNDALERARSLMKEDQHWADSASSKATTIKVVSGLGGVAGLGFIGLGVVLVRRRRASSSRQNSPQPA